MRGGWDQRVEIRNDTLARRRLAWQGDRQGWKIVGGDLTDPALSPWPQGLPRRALPLGWKAARGTPDAPQPFAAPLPQGIAAGIFQPAWSAYALRAWNPLERGNEPPWHPAWNLRHYAMGASGTATPLPWTVALHLSETRITRGKIDSLSERLAALSVASPKSRRGGIDLFAARMEAEKSGRTGSHGTKGWLVGAEFERRFANASSLALTLRQRDAAWSSAWDPAVIPATGGTRDSIDPQGRQATDDWNGAGEARLSGRLPLEATGLQMPASSAASLNAEAWRAWNPAAGTERRGARGVLAWQLDEARLKLSGTHRTARAASGSVSLYRYLEAEMRLTNFPGWRVAAWRASNREGPLRTGGFLGAEPAWRSLRLTPGMRLDQKTDAEGTERVEGTALLGFRWRSGSGWSLDASGAVPCWPWPAHGLHGLREMTGENTHWRVTVEYAGR
jgi:hypothetical protein